MNVAADSVLLGIEAHGDVKLTAELTAEVDLRLGAGRVEGSGDPLPRIPPYRVLGGLRYQRNAFQIGGSVQMVSEQTRVFGAETPTDGYTTGEARSRPIRSTRAAC